MIPHAWLTAPEMAGQGQTGRWPLDQAEVTLGRRPPADVVLALPRISRQHALITRTEHGYYISDMGSRNGTFVNGQPLSSTPQRLWEGAEIVLGGVITLHFDDPDETAQGPHIGRLSGIWINSETQDVWVDAMLLQPPLSAAQFSLLNLLYQANGQIITREQIMAAVWPHEEAAGISGEAIDGLIKRLRHRLRQLHSQSTDYIEVVRNRGLRLRQ